MPLCRSRRRCIISLLGEYSRYSPDAVKLTGVCWLVFEFWTRAPPPHVVSPRHPLSPTVQEDGVLVRDHAQQRHVEDLHGSRQVRERGAHQVWHPARRLVRSARSCSVPAVLGARTLGLSAPPLAPLRFHVDDLSSAHVYIRMPDGYNIDMIPDVVLAECAQLVKVSPRSHSLVTRLSVACRSPVTRLVGG